MVKKPMIALLMLLLVGVMGACSVSTTPGGSSAKTVTDDSQVTIGFSVVTQQSPFYVQLRQGIEQAANKAGAKVLFADANGDVTKQNNDIQDLITRGVNVLIVNPVDSKGVVASMKAAKAANVPTISIDRPTDSGQTAFVGRDNVEMGKLVGAQVAKLLGSAGGKVVEIQGDAGGQVARDRGAGFAQGVAKNPKIKIVKGPFAEYQRANAVTAMQDLLQANPDLKAVYAHNDDMAMGALQVLREHNRSDVLVASVDGLMEAVKTIATGKQYVATALNDPIHEAQLAVDVAIKAARGKHVESKVDAGTQLVTADNAKELVGSNVFARQRG